MFFIIVFLLILALLIILAFACKIKAVIKADNGDISVTISFLHIIRLRKKYIVKYEDKTILSLYLKTKKGLKPVISLPDAVRRISRSELTDITFVDFITVFTQSLRKKKKKTAFNYIIARTKYDIVIELKLGLDDAFYTAIACGLFNTAAGTACAILNAKKHILRIKSYPEFSKLFISVNADCIITLSPADIIIGYAIYKKNKRR